MGRKLCEIVFLVKVMRMEKEGLISFRGGPRGEKKCEGQKTAKPNQCLSTVCGFGQPSDFLAPPKTLTGC